MPKHRETFRRLAHHYYYSVVRSLGSSVDVRSDLHDVVSTAGTTTVDEDIVHLLENAELSMLFRGSSQTELGDWQAAFRAKLLELLGDTAAPSSWRVVEENRTTLKDHVRHQLLLVAENVPAVPVYLLVPHDRSTHQQLPAVVCIHGHGPFGNDPVVGRRELAGVEKSIRKHNYDYGLQFVRSGYVVAAPCLIPFGRRIERKTYGEIDPCAVAFVRMQTVGRLPIAANLRDLRWTIDFLQQRPEVDGARIGCAGLSYGGRMTTFLAALDSRIRVAAISGALNLQQERMTHRRSCGSQIVPGLLKYGDYSEVGSLIAPRPCVWETGTRDSVIVPHWDDVFRERLRRAWTAGGALDRLNFDRFDGAHAWSGKVAAPLFDQVLKA